MNEESLNERFYEELIKEDELGAAIRAHLDIEYWVNELIKLIVPHPEHLKPIELDYYCKVHLLCSLGLNKEYKAPLLFMGKIRNKFAHNINFSIDKELVNNLYKSFSKDCKEIAQRVFKNTELSNVNEKYDSFRQMRPRDQFVFMAVNVRNMIKSSVIVERKRHT